MGDTFCFVEKGVTYFHPTANILRIRAEGNYTVVFVKGNKQIVLTENIGAFLKKLDEGMFVRVHDSHAVNRKEICSLEGRRSGLLCLSDGSRIPVSQRKFKFVRDLLKNK